MIVASPNKMRLFLCCDGDLCLEDQSGPKSIDGFRPELLEAVDTVFGTR